MVQLSGPGISPTLVDMSEPWSGHGDQPAHMDSVFTGASSASAATVREVIGRPRRVESRRKTVPVSLLWVITAAAAGGSVFAVRDALFASPGNETTRSVWTNPGKRADLPSEGISVPVSASTMPDRSTAGSASPSTAESVTVPTTIGGADPTTTVASKGSGNQGSGQAPVTATTTVTTTPAAGGATGSPAVSVPSSNADNTSTSVTTATSPDDSAPDESGPSTTDDSGSGKGKGSGSGGGGGG
jgi:hypothetical protein